MPATERRPETSAGDQVGEALDVAITALTRFIARTWVELALLAALAGVYHLAGAIAVAGVVALILIIPQLRRPLRALLRAQHVKRQWTQAVIASGAADPPPKRSRRAHSPTGARATRVRQVNTGDRLSVRLAPGTSVQDLAGRREALAASLSTRWAPVRDVRIIGDEQRADRATALVVRRDPFDDPAPIPWPLADAEATSLWNPIPVGRDEQGEEVTVSLATEDQGGLNMLIGGIPGSGKSVAQSVWVAAAALDPSTRLWIMDGKQLDTAIWAPCAERMVGPNGDEAIHLLLELHHEMELRRRDLLARDDGAEKIHPSMGLPLHFLLVDELAAYLRLPDKQQVNEILRLLLDLISRGRASGIVVCMATQKPSAELHPQFTDLRDLVTYRLAFRVTNWQMSDMVLGTGYSKAGHNAADIRHAQRGVGLLMAEGHQPVKLRHYYLSREQIRDIAKRAAQQRIPDDASEAVLLEGGTVLAPARPRMTAEQLRAAQNREELMTKLPMTGNGWARPKIEAVTGRPWKELWPTVRDLMDEDLVYRKGRGVKGDPHCYLKVRGTAAQDPNSMDSVPPESL